MPPLEPHVLILGPPKVGKSSFLIQFAHNHWMTDPYVLEEDDSWRKCPAYGGHVWVITLTDLAKCEEDLAPNEEAISVANALILFYDLCSLDSYNVAQSQAQQLTYWFNTHAKPLPPLVVVGTHLDLADTSRQVSTDEAKAWALSLAPRVKFFEASNKVHADTQAAVYGLLDLILDEHGLQQKKKERCVIQ